MERLKVIISMFLIICVVLFTGCRPSQTTPDSMQKEEPAKMPKALFIYIHYYGDIDEMVSYIDDTGNVYVIETPKKEYLTLQDIYERIDKSKDEIMASVDEEQLKSNYQLFLQVPIESGEHENLIYTYSTDDWILGNHEWYGLRYDKNGELEYFILAGEGDTAIENQDKTAQKIANWLRGILINTKGITFN